jgi:uncharacterized protein
MPSLAAIREQRQSARLTALRASAADVAANHPGGEVWLFGSLARGDWDACSDVDLLALSQERWQQLKGSDDPYWRAIGRDALRLDQP